MTIDRELILQKTLSLHDLYYGTDHCDRKYVQVCPRFQALIVEAGDKLRKDQA